MIFRSKSVQKMRLLLTPNSMKLSTSPWRFSGESLPKLNKVVGAEASAREAVKREEMLQKEAENMKAAVAVERLSAVETKSAMPKETDLAERKEYSDLMLNVDPFDEVPGPEILKKISSIWKYLPQFGCQATVSATLSFFRLSKMSNNILGYERSDRPFSKLFRKYGPIVKLHGPLGAQIVLICRPEHIAKVYEQEGKYPIRSTLDSVEKCRSKSRKTYGGPFNLSGIEWEEMRKAIEEPLIKGGGKYFRQLEGVADNFVKSIYALRNKQNEVGEALMNEIGKWSLECLCLITLDKALGFLQSEACMHASESNRLAKAVAEATKSICKCENGFQMWRFINTPASIALTKACETIDSIISKHIRYAQLSLTRKKEQIGDGKTTFQDLPFIESLLLNECMTPEEILTCIVDVLLIGVNTSSSALGFLLYHVAQNQRAQKALFKEVKEILPEKKSKLDYNQLSSMPYLEACVMESLRLRMPMPIVTRVLAADVILSNFRIPKGTYMVMDTQAACLRETDFENPKRFIPERWLEPLVVHPFAFVPFGHGLRSCVGRNLAETQLKSCAVKIIRRFQLEYNYQDIYSSDSVITFPSKPLKLTFIERDD